MKLAEEIKYRRKQEVANARLAARYAKSREYENAAAYYRAAAFHLAVRLCLEAKR